MSNIAAEIISTAEANTPEWHRVRHEGIGGSEAAAVCGMSPWATPYSLWLEKTGPCPTGNANEAALWGTLLEGVVRGETARREELTITAAAGTYGNIERPWQHYNADGLIGVDGIYEGKTCSLHYADDWADGGIPDHYKLQGLHGLATLGGQYRYVLFSCLIGGQRLVTTRMERDDDAITALIKIETEFWERVLDGAPPPVDGSEATANALRDRWHPDARTVTVVDRQEVTGLLAAREASKRVIEQETSRRQEIDNQLKAMLGAATDATDETGELLFTWRPNKDGNKIDTARLLKDHPELAETYRIPTKGARPFRAVWGETND